MDPRYDQIKAKIAKRKESFTKKIDKMSPAQMLLHIQEIYKINAMLEVLQDPLDLILAFDAFAEDVALANLHTYIMTSETPELDLLDELDDLLDDSELHDFITEELADMFLDDEAELAKYDLDADEQARRTYNEAPFRT